MGSDLSHIDLLYADFFNATFWNQSILNCPRLNIAFPWSLLSWSALRWLAQILSRLTPTTDRYGKVFGGGLYQFWQWQRVAGRRSPCPAVSNIHIKSVTFVKILIRMNVRIYSYQQNYTNEYPNIFILIFLTQ